LLLNLRHLPLDIQKVEEHAMPSTHLRLLYHIIFSTKGRCHLISECWEGSLYSFLGGILRRLGGVAEIIGGADDHVHILASLKATHCLATIMREIKASSSVWIHNEIGKHLFKWQEGYGAFTISNSEVGAIRQYIQEQKEHHCKKTFQEEYLDFLRQSGVEFDEKYLW
jgi:putative transposase